MEVTTIAVRIRTWKIKLAKKLKKINRRATYNEILDIAEQIYPTYQRFGGGELFLSWFLENGKLSILQ